MFSAVLAIDGITNLSGSNKLLALERYVGGRGFDYIGNSHDDLPLWRVAKQTILVGLFPWLLSKARRIWSGERVIVPKINGFSALFGALRVHQWVKNVLLFGSLIMAHRTTDMALVLNGSLAFVAFSLCASSVYIINDLVDLESDRQHPNKRKRPLASGSLQIQTGIVLVPLLLAGALLIAALLSFYFVLTMAYSLYFRRTLFFWMFYSWLDFIRFEY